MKHGGVAQQAGPRRAVQIVNATVPQLCVGIVEDGLVHRLGRQREAMRMGVHVAEVNHEVHVAEAQRMAGQVGAVAMPLLV